MHNNIFPHCHRCGQSPEKGLYDGFRVGGVFFCRDCEQELLNADMGSSVYQEFILLLRGALIKGERVEGIR